MAAKNKRLDCDGLIRADNNYTTCNEGHVVFPR
jgi:hypothetical protein